MKYLILFILIAVISCQYPVDISTLPETQKYLGIDASVTEDFVQVNVSYTLENVSSSGAYSLPKPPVAKAFLLDSKGGRYPIKNLTGVKDTLFRGMIGETYQLVVEADGKMYESDKQTMQATPELDSLIVEYSRESFRTKDDLLYDGFDIYAESRDIPGKKNYYQWHWTNYSKALFCLRQFSKSEGREIVIPCNPPYCWNIIQNERVIVQNDNLRDGQPLDQLVVRVPYFIPPSKYYLQVEQRSITSQVYDYLKSIETQTEGVGTLFDIPAQTRFNPTVHNISDKNEKLLGVFSVYSRRSRVVIIDMSQSIPNAVPKIIPIPTNFPADALLSSPCTEESYRTKVRPPGWVD